MSRSFLLLLLFLILLDFFDLCNGKEDKKERLYRVWKLSLLEDFDDRGFLYHVPALLVHLVLDSPIQGVYHIHQ